MAEGADEGMNSPSAPPASRNCAASTRAGAPCPNAARAGAPFCALHDPAIAQPARVAGGRARTAALGTPRPMLSAEEAERLVQLRDARDVPATLEAIARAVVSGRLDCRVGNMVVGAASAAVRAIDAADLARRLELLEVAAKRRR